MDQEEFHRRYLERLTEAGLSCGEAYDILIAGMGGYDYEDGNPEDEADAELSYMTNDS